VCIVRGPTEREAQAALQRQRSAKERRGYPAAPDSSSASPVSFRASPVFLAGQNLLRAILGQQAVARSSPCQAAPRPLRTTGVA
jgi:hypothetical protein